MERVAVEVPRAVDPRLVVAGVPSVLAGHTCHPVHLSDLLQLLGLIQIDPLTRIHSLAHQRVVVLSVERGDHCGNQIEQ